MDLRLQTQPVFVMALRRQQPSRMEKHHSNGTVFPQTNVIARGRHKKDCVGFIQPGTPVQLETDKVVEDTDNIVDSFAALFHG